MVATLAIGSLVPVCCSSHSMQPLQFFPRRAFSAVAAPPARPLPVLIVGAGPVGLSLSILLSQYDTVLSSQQRLEDFTSEVCHDIILEVAGRRDLTVEIKTVKEWVMHAEDADRFVDRHGRIILAGDATYRFPPAGRFSLNTGIQDAHNLTWKLAAVLKDQASKTLLSTDEVERKPVVWLQKPTRH